MATLVVLAEVEVFDAAGVGLAEVDVVEVAGVFDIGVLVVLVEVDVVVAVGVEDIFFVELVTGVVAG